MAGVPEVLCIGDALASNLNPRCEGLGVFSGALYLHYLGEMAGAVVIGDLGYLGVCCAGAVLVGQILLPPGLLDLTLVHAVKVEAEYKLWCLPTLCPSSSSHCLIEF